MLVKTKKAKLCKIEAKYLSKNNLIENSREIVELFPVQRRERENCPGDIICVRI